MSDRFIKLVRDHVGNPDDEVVYKKAILFTDVDFHRALSKKLSEEADEYEQALSWGELIDVYEVVWALTELHGKSMRDLAHDAEVVRLARGSFLNRMSMWIRRTT